MVECEAKILQICEERNCSIFAWCVLPNHYHLLIRTDKIDELRSRLGKFHGSSSFHWNGEDNLRGRRVWFRCVERPMRSERHFWATLNYIHNNSVKHGYVKRWQDWPFSSAKQFIEKYGRERTLEIWKEYPVLEYGVGWDD